MPYKCLEVDYKEQVLENAQFPLNLDVDKGMVGAQFSG